MELNPGQEVTSEAGGGKEEEETEEEKQQQEEQQEEQQQQQILPRVLAMPVLTLDITTWLIRFSCSGFTRTAIFMFHSVCTAI